MALSAQRSANSGGRLSESRLAISIRQEGDNQD
jgi:hypothetical protein